MRVCAWWWIRSFDGFPPFRLEKLALYPHTRTRALGMYFGRKSGWESQQILFCSAVQLLMASPLRPWTATMLEIKASQCCSALWNDEHKSNSLHIRVCPSRSVDFLNTKYFVLPGSHIASGALTARQKERILGVNSLDLIESVRKFSRGSVLITTPSNPSWLCCKMGYQYQSLSAKVPADVKYRGLLTRPIQYAQYAEEIELFTTHVRAFFFTMVFQYRIRIQRNELNNTSICVVFLPLHSLLRNTVD